MAMRLGQPVDNWTDLNYSSIMSKELSIDPAFDKQAVFQLLSKFNLSAGDVAEVFASYLNLHPPTAKDLGSFRGSLRQRGNRGQIEILNAIGPLLTSDQIKDKLGLASRQSIHNYKKNKALLSVSFENRRGDYFPAFQLDGAEIRPWIPQLLKPLPNGWSALAFLTARRKDLDGGSFLTAVLENQKMVPAMLAAADAYVS